MISIERDRYKLGRPTLDGQVASNQLSDRMLADRKAGMTLKQIGAKHDRSITSIWTRIQSARDRAQQPTERE